MSFFKLPFMTVAGILGNLFAGSAGQGGLTFDAPLMPPIRWHPTGPTAFHRSAGGQAHRRWRKRRSSGRR